MKSMTTFLNAWLLVIGFFAAVSMVADAWAPYHVTSPSPTSHQITAWIP